MCLLRNYKCVPLNPNKIICVVWQKFYDAKFYLLFIHYLTYMENIFKFCLCLASTVIRELKNLVVHNQDNVQQQHSQRA